MHNISQPLAVTYFPLFKTAQVKSRNYFLVNSSGNHKWDTALEECEAFKKFNNLQVVLNGQQRVELTLLYLHEKTHTTLLFCLSYCLSYSIVYNLRPFLNYEGTDNQPKPIFY